MLYKKLEKNDKNDFVDKSIQEFDDFHNFVETEKAKTSDENKKLLLEKIQALLFFFINIFASFFPRNMEGTELVYEGLKQKKTSTILTGFYMLRISKRILISESWNSFENFFQQKIGDDTKIGQKLTKKYYGGLKKIPKVIDFFRETRNTLHNNSMYSKGKQPIFYKNYKLEPGKEISWAGFPELLDIIRDSIVAL